MRLVNVHRSTRRDGGWIVDGTPKRDAKQVFGGLPSAHCRRNATYGIWWVSDEGLALLEPYCANWADVTRRAGYRKKTTQQPPPQAPSQVNGSSPYAQLWLLDGAPFEVVKAAYRALAQLTHPDTERDPVKKARMTERMTRYNLAFEEIEQKRREAQQARVR